jgi:uncharacterized damage-inducible protein DinB
MHIKDRTEVLANLKSGPKALLEVLANVTDEVAKRSPGQGRWSVLECVEHVATAEEYLLHQISTAKRSEIPQVNIAREAAIVRRGTDRTRRIRAPEVARPRNRFSTLKDALRHFQETREKTIQFVENCLDDPRAMIAHHPLIGPANNYEILLIMAVHPHRHAEQIREILSAVVPAS